MTIHENIKETQLKCLSIIYLRKVNATDMLLYSLLQSPRFILSAFQLLLLELLQLVLMMMLLANTVVIIVKILIVGAATETSNSSIHSRSSRSSRNRNSLNVN